MKIIVAINNQVIIHKTVTIKLIENSFIITQMQRKTLEQHNLYILKNLIHNIVLLEARSLVTT